MDIKIETTPDLLKDIHRYLTSQQIEIDEEYRQVDGFHLEANVTGIILVLSPIAIAAIKGFVT